MKKRIVFVLFIMVLVIAFSYSCKKKSSDSGSVPNLGAAEPAPAFEVTSLDGTTISLDSLKGKVILVNFWATWCPPCRAEIPDFIETYSELKDKGLEILGFSVDDLPEAELKKFVEQAKMNYPVALVGKDVVAAFKPGQYIPTSIFIDKNGNIRKRHVGKLEKSDLMKVFEELNKE